MSRIRTEIQQSMTPLNLSGSELQASFRFTKQFAGFQGHFPTNMVLPGACQIQCVLSTIEYSLSRKVILKEILAAKFFSPILPEETVTCIVRDVARDGEFTVKAVINKGAAKATELKLKVSA